jgi:hypothetical protein
MMNKEHIKTIGRELTAEEFDVLIKEYMLEGWREINDGSVSSPGTFSDFQDSFIDMVIEAVGEAGQMKLAEEH